MRLKHRGLAYKLLGGIRVVIFLIFNHKTLSIGLPSIIGTQSSFFTKKGGTITVGKKSAFYDNVEVQSRGKMSIGEKCSINNHSRIIAFENIEIGDNVVIAQFVSILDHDHAFEMKNGQLNIEGYTTAPIKIGNNVWIADKVTILKGVTIGDNVVIGANSLVNKDIPSNSIAGGVPCKVLKSL